MSTVLEQHLVELAQRIDVVDDERLVDDVLARLDSPVRRSPFESRRRSLAVVGLLTAAAVALVFVLPSPLLLMFAAGA